MKFMVALLCCLCLVGSSYGSLYADLPDADQVLVVDGVPASKALSVGRPVSMLVWNVYKHKLNGLMSDLAQLARSHDISVLQESMMDSVMTPFFRSNDGVAWVSALSFYTGDREATGVTTGSKYKMFNMRYARSRVREPIIGTPKMILYTQFAIGGSKKSLLVANIHGINFVSTKKFRNQIMQMSADLSSHTGPMIVAGDFNTRNRGRWRVISEFARRHGLALVPLKNDQRSRKLDNILVRGMVIIKGEVLSAVRTSDHKPLRMVFTLE